MDWNERTRTLACFGASVLAHMVVIVGLVIRPPAGPAAGPGVIEARLEGAVGPIDDAQLTGDAPIDGLSERATVDDPPHPPRTVPPQSPEVNAARAQRQSLPASPTAGPTEVDEEASESPLPEIESVAAVDDTWYAARQLDVLPTALVEVQPAYPEAAAAQSIAGEVTLLLLVDEMGQVRERSVVESEPPGVFDEAALAAFRKVPFQPAMKDGRRVRSRVLVTVSFNPDSAKAEEALSEPADPQ